MYDKLMRITVKTNDNLEFHEEIKSLIDYYHANFSEKKGSVFFEPIYMDSGALSDEISQRSRHYPTEEFTVEESHESDDHSIKEVYKLLNGEKFFQRKELYYYKAEESIDIRNVPDAKPLLDEAFEWFRKIDTNESGGLKYSPHKHTIEIEGEEYKMVVSKKHDIYNIKKIFKKIPTWIKYRAI